MGFFTDAYDFFAISLVIDIIRNKYYHQEPIPKRVSAAIHSIALCGAVRGQLVFGWLGDKMGRKRIYGITLVLMVVTSIASGISFSNCEGKHVVITVLCFFRFWLGFGIGGDYPLSATIMSEYANRKRRGAFIATVFAMQIPNVPASFDLWMELQGFGNIAAGIVGMVVSASFRNNRISNADYVCRIVLMLGAFLAALTYYWRMKMPETARYTALVAMDVKKAALDMSSVLNVHIVPEDEAVNELEMHDQYGLLSLEFLHRHGVHLLSTSVCWLALDITLYSLNLFMKNIFTQVGLLSLYPDSCPFERMIKITALHTALTLCGALPGNFFTVAFVDRIGRVRIKLLGFTMMSVFILCLAVRYDHHWSNHKMNKYIFGAMYGMTSFFANFGPNTTTFIIPAEIFPAWLRSTCHGISGAFGKIGAIIGVFVFVYNQKYLKTILFTLVGCNVVGLGFTFLLPESKGKSLEEINGEMEEQQVQQDAAEVAATEYIHLVPIQLICGVYI
ncbi:putative inorganic phosphate transporter 1-13 [Dichanthelium oligosanthes]|uniref:H(+)/Pi cotransporter n=1 Tax=Dichanthelium oligosanthes TaxID=888268 RepID=A0A1E5VY59_9POAL|nr:putative inorganic phosphate transporter 1-13 [Dichanthelium oligosanthes]